MPTQFSMAIKSLTFSQTLDYFNSSLRNRPAIGVSDNQNPNIYLLNVDTGYSNPLYTDTTGTYNLFNAKGLGVKGNSADATLYLYENSFNSTNLLLNSLVANEDMSPKNRSRQIVNYTLNANTQYIAIESSFNQYYAISYSVNIFGLEGSNTNSGIYTPPNNGGGGALVPEPALV